MKLLHKTGEGRPVQLKANEALAREAESKEVDSPARAKLLKEWTFWKPELVEWPAWRYSGDDPELKTDPGPFESYMKRLLIVAGVAPEKIPEIRTAIGADPWKQLKTFLELHSEGHIIRVDMWITHAVGARILFPDHATEVVSLFRPQMKRMFDQKHFISDDSVGSYLVQTYLADPEFPGLQELIEQKLPILRKNLLDQLSSKEHAPGVVYKAAYLFLLSPQDRDRLQDRVMQYLEQNKARIDQDFESGIHDRRFAGYFIEEPWYSAVVCKEAKLKNGRLVFERDRPVSHREPLPVRAAL